MAELPTEVGFSAFARFLKRIKKKKEIKENTPGLVLRLLLPLGVVCSAWRWLTVALSCTWECGVGGLDSGYFQVEFNF